MAIDLPLPGTFEEAIAWAKARGVVLPDDFYNTVATDARGRAFTVSYLTSLAQIQAAMDSLTESLAQGETFEQWKARAGETVGTLTDAHMETVFRNFHQNAYNAGRWKQFEANKDAFPYLMFSAINDARTTDICRHRNGIIRRADDPFWNRNSPQMHHNCRSTLISLTESQAAKRSSGPTGINKPTPTDEPGTGWGYKPTSEEAARGLAEAVKSAAGAAPSGWFETIMGLFASGWSFLSRLLASIF